MRPGSDWLEWEELWRADRTSPAQLEELIERTRRARRSLTFLRVLPAMLAIVALLAVAGALRHAGNAFERSLGIVVAIGIIGVWLMDFGNQRRASERLEAPAEEYIAVRRALCQRQLRFATLASIVTALDLVFLVPWWIGGFRVHGVGFHVAQLVSLWGPLALILGFTWWTTRLRRRARGELARLTSLNVGRE